MDLHGFLTHDGVKEHTDHLAVFIAHHARPVGVERANDTTVQAVANGVLQGHLVEVFARPVGKTLVVGGGWKTTLVFSS